MDNLAVNTLRINGISAIREANSGHPGIVLGASPIIHTIFNYHLNFDVQNPLWVNRDRFILSAGHGSALLYAMLYNINLISKQDLMAFRQLNSLTPGHPEYLHTKGVDATTGPLGQGIAMGIGQAIAERYLNSSFQEVDHHTYVVCGDGDLQEGVAMEAMSLAGHLKLHKLIVLHDSNDVQLDTDVSKTFTENLKQRMEAINWEYIKVENGDNVDEINKAIKKAKLSKKPTFIEVKTVIGLGSKLAGTSKVHGAPLNEEDFESVKAHFNWSYGNFEIPSQVRDYYQKNIIERGKKAFQNWTKSSQLKDFLSSNLAKFDLSVEIEKDLATRDSSGKVINYLNSNLKHWIGGSADLSGSTKVKGKDDFTSQNYQGNNINFGVREFAMGSIANGIALHSNLRPFVSTFFVFSDYLKPAIRLSALMKLPVTYVFTHDSIQVGEDGPTHQPIEQIAMLRSIPNLSFFRPCDEKEVLGSYKLALENSKKPSAIVLTRQKIKSFDETSIPKFKEGPYYLINNDSDFNIVASGSEVELGYEIAKKLNFNLISISNSNFNNGDIFWNKSNSFSLEASTTYGMQKFAQYNFGIDEYGKSGKGDLVYKEVGFDFSKIIQKIKLITKI